MTHSIQSNQKSSITECDKSISEIEVLNRAIQTGDETYWRNVYHIYFNPIALFLSHEYGPLPSDVAEELSYKALLKLVTCKRKPQFKDKRQLVAWLYKAARTTAIDYWRSLDGQFHHETDLYENPDELLVNIDKQIEESEIEDSHVNTALLQLNERDRIVLMMRANGTPFRLIAEELCIEENAARTYFARAKKKFSRIYNEITNA